MTGVRKLDVVLGPSTGTKDPAVAAAISAVGRVALSCWDMAGDDLSDPRYAPLNDAIENFRRRHRVPWLQLWILYFRGGDDVTRVGVAAIDLFERHLDRCHAVHALKFQCGRWRRSTYAPDRAGDRP
jgi:hypothetical protein